MTAQIQAKFEAAKLFSKASSVLFIRRDISQPKTTPLNFQLLMLRRNPALRAFGGYWAWPGGKIEKQDYLEYYTQKMPEKAHEFAAYSDFDKRIATIRECFEETNILIANKSSGPGLRDILNSQYRSDFQAFMNKFDLQPAMDQLIGHFRIAPPSGVYPSTDTMFYLCYDKTEHESKVLGCDLQLETQEFVDARWMTVPQVLQAYAANEVQMFPPQTIITVRMLFQNHTFDQLVSYACQRQKTLAPYLTERSHMLALGQNDPVVAKRQISELFDEYDLQPDSNRPGLKVWTNDQLIAKDPALAVFSKNAERNYEKLYEGLTKCNCFVMNRDFHSNQEIVSNYRVTKNTRFRLYGFGMQRLFRIEISDEILSV